jgi:hypothetical protein
MAGRVARVASLPERLIRNREASFLYEASRQGFKTDAQLHDLLHNPARVHVLTEIQRRARDAAIEYESRTRADKIAGKGVFIYPWVKGSTLYAGRFLRDHPQQANLLYQQGAQARAHEDQLLGARPFWTQGMARVGGTNAKPLVTNPLFGEVFGEPAQMLSTAGSLARGQTPPEQPAQWLSPPIGLGISELTGRNTTSGKAEGRLQLLKDQVTGFPAVSGVQALMGGVKPKPGSIYQRSTFQQGEKFLAGRAATSTISQANLNKAGLKEQMAGWPAQKKALYTVQQQQTAYEAEMRKYGVHQAFVGGKLGPSQQRAWSEQAQLKVAVSNLPHYHNPSPAQKLDYQRRKVTAAVDLAVKLGKWDAQAAGMSSVQYKTLVLKSTRVYRLRSGYDWINRKFLSGGFLAQWKAAVRAQHPDAFRTG